MRGLRGCARQVPEIDARVILVAIPCRVRIPPLILRLVTTGRRLRSAVRLLPNIQAPLLDDQDTPVGSPEIGSRFHSRYMA